MNIASQIRIFLVKLQNLPEQEKKIILWIIVVAIAVVMGFFLVGEVADSFSKISKEMGQIKIPQISAPNMPSLNILQTTSPSNGK